MESSGYSGKYILDTREQLACSFSMKPPRTLQEAIIYFSDPDRAFEYAVKLRWPDGKVICPRCSSETNYFIKTRKLWLCRGCDKQFTLKVNTIFEDSPRSWHYPEVGMVHASAASHGAAYRIVRRY